MIGSSHQWLGAPQVSALSHGHRLISYESASLAIDALVEDMIKTMALAITTKGCAVITGCGGQTPKPLYARLADAPLLWAQVSLIVLDERHVPSTDSRSNYGMMKAVFDTKPAAAMSLCCLSHEQLKLGDAATKANQDLASTVTKGIDYALLGMGNDAHFASIFPHHQDYQAQWLSHDLVLPIAKSDTQHQEPVIDRLSLSPKPL